VGLDEINKLGELGTGALLGIALILVLLLAWRFLGGENSARRLTLEALTESVKALTAQNSAIVSLDDKVGDLKRQNELSYANAARTMADVTTQRKAEFKEGVDIIREDIGFVPGNVGKVTEPQIDTIRKALMELEERVGKRIDESAGRITEKNQDNLRIEIDTLTDNLLKKFDELTEVVPERVTKAVITALPRPADDTLADTQHALKTSEQRAVKQAMEIDKLKRGTGPLVDLAKPPDDDGHEPGTAKE
jgi:hypothetical protein